VSAQLRLLLLLSLLLLLLLLLLLRLTLLSLKVGGFSSWPLLELQDALGSSTVSEYLLLLVFLLLPLLLLLLLLFFLCFFLIFFFCCCCCAYTGRYWCVHQLPGVCPDPYRLLTPPCLLNQQAKYIIVYLFS
jgi:hypothetical protein